MTSYIVKTTRRDLALYLSWEFGIQRAHDILQKVPGKSIVTVPDNVASMFGTKRKRDAETLAKRIQIAVAYQNGRLRKPLTGCDAWITQNA